MKIGTGWPQSTKKAPNTVSEAEEPVPEDGPSSWNRQIQPFLRKSLRTFTKAFISPGVPSVRRFQSS